MSYPVIPAKAGIQVFIKYLDSRFRGNRPCMGHSPQVMKPILARYGYRCIFVRWGWWPKDVVIKGSQARAGIGLSLSQHLNEPNSHRA